jgi:hypothetical protein
LIDFNGADSEDFAGFANEWDEALRGLDEHLQLRLLFALAVQERLIEPNTIENRIDLETAPGAIQIGVTREGRRITENYALREILDWGKWDQQWDGFGHALAAIVEKANTDLKRSALPA